MPRYRRGPLTWDGRTLHGPPQYLAERGEQLLEAIFDGTDGAFDSMLLADPTHGHRCILERIFVDWAMWHTDRIDRGYLPTDFG